MLKPVDLQTIIPRSVDVQRIQQHHNIRPQIEQRQLAREMLQLSQEGQSKVKQTDASVMGGRIQDEVEDKASGNSGRRYRRFLEKKKPSVKTEKQDDKEEGVNEPGQHIDIKV